MAGRLNRIIRKVNKYVTNPLLMHWAGRGSFYAGVIHHVGRRTSRAYATPVYPVLIPGGVVIPLPYGADTDWCRNVRVAGTGQLAIRGRRLRFVDPRVVAASELASVLSPEMYRRFARYRRCLRCRTVS